jgi:hypothetical protein
MKANSCPPRPEDYPVAAKDRASLEGYFGAGNVIPLGSRDAQDVLVIVGKKKEKQVWVRPSSEGRTQYALYKKAYEAVHGPVSSGYQVDHVQSQKRAGQQEYKYVRLCPVKKEVNQAWGVRLECRTVRLGERGYIEPRGPLPIRQIDQFQWWKIQGLMPGDTPYGARAT